MIDSVPQDDPPRPIKIMAGDSVLTDAVRHADIIHTSLAGMTAIVSFLLVAVALPVFGLSPVTSVLPFVIMVIASFVGISGLYYLNYKVHQHVTDQARLTEVLVNSLGQGFMVFDQMGICGKVYSQACIELLEDVPAGKDIVDILRISDENRGDFRDWFSIFFQGDHAIGFEDVVRFLPSQFPHSKGLRVGIIYRPIYNKEGKIEHVVVIADDQTAEYKARERAKKQEIFADMLCRIFKDRSQFQSTLKYVHEFLDDASSTTIDRRDATSLVRQLHTLKASSKQFSLFDLAEIIHSVESALRDPAISSDDEFRRALQEGRQRIANELSYITNLVSSLIGGENEWKGNIRDIAEVELYEFAREMAAQNVSRDVIQLYLSKIAAVPIRDCFHSFERELKDLASMMDKQVKPVCYAGDNPRILTQPLQNFLFSLVHICRNIADHGIEPAVTRLARGKDPAGLVTVQTEIISREAGAGQWLHIMISDDGGGIDPSRIRSKLAAQDPHGPWRLEDDQSVIQHIFSGGISTSESLTTISGRGVGMEAVAKQVSLLGGKISVRSVLYKGAVFDIQIPYLIDIPDLNDQGKDQKRIQA